jgi:hypothetical protein
MCQRGQSRFRAFPRMLSRRGAAGRRRIATWAGKSSFRMPAAYPRRSLTCVPAFSVNLAARTTADGLFLGRRVSFGLGGCGAPP